MRWQVASKNCPNCAAPYDVSLNKCPYCGTSYFDMSCIDINSLEPFYIKLKMGDMMVTSKVVVKEDASITISEDVMDVVNKYGDKVGRVVTGKSVDIDIGFKSVADRKGSALLTAFID